MSKDFFYTILNSGWLEIEIKKSKFISHAKSIGTQDEAVQFINSIKNKYKDATHNVYAYSVGVQSKVQRFDDDGEPKGTSGIPILEVINNMKLDNIVIVVTRYFGGTLLGAGGLIRAYSKSARLIIEKCKIVKKISAKEVVITLDYSFLGKIDNYLKSNNIMISDIDYKDNVVIKCGIDDRILKKRISDIRDITNNKVNIDIIGDIYIDLQQENKL